MSSSVHCRYILCKIGFVSLIGKYAMGLSA